MSKVKYNESLGSRAVKYHIRQFGSRWLFLFVMKVVEFKLAELKGRTHSEETKKKISESNKATKALSRRPCSAETKEKMRVLQKLFWTDERRIERSEKIKLALAKKKAARGII